MYSIMILVMGLGTTPHTKEKIHVPSWNAQWKYLKRNDWDEICCMEWDQTTLKLQVIETFSCTILRESATDWAEDFIGFTQGFRSHSNFFLLQKTWELVRDCQYMQSPGVLGLVFYTRLNVTPLVGHLGWLAWHWSVYVGCSSLCCIAKQRCLHGPACIAFHCSHLYITTIYKWEQLEGYACRPLNSTISYSWIQWCRPMDVSSLLQRRRPEIRLM